jgi:hypothetical protein
LFQIRTFAVDCFPGSKGDSSNTCYTILNELLFYIYLFQGDHFTSGKQALKETGVNGELRRSLIIGCAGYWEPPSITIKDLASNSDRFSFTHYRRLTMSLKLTKSTARDFTARKNLFREMATVAARIVYVDLAARCRSLAPVR